MNNTGVTSIVLAFNEVGLLQYTLPNIIAISDGVIVVDMESTDGSIDLYQSLLRPCDRVVSFPRADLFRYGFSHARNYGAKFASSEWIFSVDSDELLRPDEFLSLWVNYRNSEGDVLNLIRRNHIKIEGLSLENIPEIIQRKNYKEEHHRRIYRNKPRVRWEGMIHEELWIDAENAYDHRIDIPFHLEHLNQYKPGLSEHLKFGLYSYLTIQGILYPSMRYGTNIYWYTEFPKVNLKAMIETANDFASRNSLPFVDELIVAGVLESEQWGRGVNNNG